ncbi:GNAT family N-acetyltransferase [uncultured Sphaerochaeta sp.]|uniref:GNAT family N-acetyltransferase n=1 Tax=uncultured Sphaerochaeta sp. TaxID=886478 RepID=UPI002A0A74B4|nr:GNAT family N-acetyltransferase [uncultured Sphaerochaeta sp.]
MEPNVILLQKSSLPSVSFYQNLERCQAIRKIVFVEGQNVPPDIDIDGRDPNCSHLLLLIGKKPAGTLRMRKTSEGTKLERVSILKEFRGCNYGKLLIQCALALSDLPVYIHAQVQSEGFYKTLGFQETDPTIFYEANIPHKTMHWSGTSIGVLPCNITRLS